VYDCLGLGISPLDILAAIDKYPPAGSKIDSRGLTIQGGGPVPNAMVALSRLGMKTSAIIPVGQDIFGELLIDELKSEGVDTSLIVRKNEPTALATGWIEQGTGNRTIVLNREITIKPNDIKLNQLPDTKSVHLDGRDLDACLKLARWAKRKGIIVIFDVGSMRNDVTPILHLVDHLVCADAFALPSTRTSDPKSAIERLNKICRGTIVITSGIKGSDGFDMDSGHIHQRAFKVRNIDTTGAGDAYHGAYIYGLLKGWNLKKRMEFASAAAAIKCRKPGARSGMPKYRQIVSFLKKGPVTYA